MSSSKHPIDVGAPLPELQNSPVISDIDDEREMIDPEIPEERMCYFNGKSYAHGTYVKSGTLVLLCDRGAWVEAEDPDIF
ncbi:MAG: DUF1496 domain-containing protein [Pseudomonadales bacterium]